MHNIFVQFNESNKKLTDMDILESTMKFFEEFEEVDELFRELDSELNRCSNAQLICATVSEFGLTPAVAKVTSDHDLTMALGEQTASLQQFIDGTSEKAIEVEVVMNEMKKFIQDSMNTLVKIVLTVVKKLIELSGKVVTYIIRALNHNKDEVRELRETMDETIKEVTEVSTKDISSRNPMYTDEYVMNVELWHAGKHPKQAEIELTPTTNYAAFVKIRETLANKASMLQDTDALIQDFVGNLDTEYYNTFQEILKGLHFDFYWDKKNLSLNRLSLDKSKIGKKGGAKGIDNKTKKPHFEAKLNELLTGQLDNQMAPVLVMINAQNGLIKDTKKYLTELIKSFDGTNIQPNDKHYQVASQLEERYGSTGRSDDGKGGIHELSKAVLAYRRSIMERCLYVSNTHTKMISIICKTMASTIPKK